MNTIKFFDLQRMFITTNHYLDYNIHLGWERRVKEGLL
jgi:hypothetical protein